MVDRCYNYTLLHSSHLCRSCKQTYKLKISPSHCRCYNMFTALLVPVPSSSMKSNIPVPFLEILSSQDNRKPAGEPIRIYESTAIKRNKT